MKAAWRLGQITIEDYQEAVSVKGFGPEKSPPKHEIPRVDIEALMQACRQDQGLHGIRDTAIISLAFKYELKPPVIAGLNLEDYDVRVGRLVVHDKKGNAETLCLDDETDRHLFNWLKIRGWEPGPIFCLDITPFPSFSEIHNRKCYSHLCFSYLVLSKFSIQ